MLFLETFAPPALVVRNGLGVNPLLLTAQNAPVIGTTWEVSVDCRNFPSGYVLHVVVDTKLEGPALGSLGQLLIDWRRPYLLLGVARHLGTQTSLFHAVPAQAALIGFPFYSQALVTGRGVRLTNALDGEFEGP